MDRVWSIVEQQANTATDSASRQETYRLYDGVADLYHSYRPRYPNQIIDQAIQCSPLLQQSKPADTDGSNQGRHILEIGCGRGTLTLPLLKRGYRVTAFDPGKEMIQTATKVCKDFADQIAFQTTNWQEFQVPSRPFDAIVAASSLHWALAEQNKDELMQKLAKALPPNGTLLLFWNFPFEPSESARNAVADAMGKPKPFHFLGGTEGTPQHVDRLKNIVLDPLESTYFSLVDTIEIETHDELSIVEFFSYLQTTSQYIAMPAEEKIPYLPKLAKPCMHTVGPN